MRVLVSGSHGFVGSAVIGRLKESGHEALRLVRSAGGPGEVPWDPANGKIAAGALEGVDAVVHLAGESIAEGRWTAAKKARILSSRTGGTRFLAGALAALKVPPKVFVCASAIGYYGDRGEEVLREDSAPGGLFLSRVCREWEAATEPASRPGVRTVNLRFGVVLGSEGGALKRMLLPFKMGVGGVLGSGKQWVSWISVDDAAGAVLHALATPGLKGPVNAVSPNPVTNREFTETLARVLGRPAVLPLPALAARLAFGQMAEELLLCSARVEPDLLQKSGFPFRHPDIEGALRAAVR